MPNYPLTFGRITRLVSVKLSVLLLFAVGYPTARLEPHSHRISAPAILQAGTSVVSEISGNETKTFELPTETRQYFHISIEKGDLRLSLVIYNGANQNVLEVTSHRYETLETSFISHTSGAYRLDIRSLESAETSRRFQLKVDPPRPAQVRDLQAAAADQIIASASNLRAEWSSSSLRKAITNYLEGRARWLSIGESREAATAALNAAEINFALGEYRQALSCLQKAASDFRKADDRLGQSRARSRAGQIYSLLGDNKKARILSRKALEYFSAFHDEHPTTATKQPFAEALTYAGEVYYSAGDLVSAFDCFDKSLRLLMEVGDRTGETRARLFLGYISATTGDSAGARKHYEQSLSLSREIGNPLAEALALAAIATAHSQERNSELAIKMHREAMAIFQLIGDRQGEAVTLVGVGQAYQLLNENQAALAQYEQALRVFEDTGNLDYASVALYQIAKIHEAEGDSKQAISFYRRCLHLSRPALKKRLLSYALNDLAALHMSLGQHQQALAEYANALRFYKHINDRRGQVLTLNNIGDFHLAAGNNAQSLVAYKRALPISRRAGDCGVEISTLYNKARAEKSVRQFPQALTSIKAAIEIIEKLLSNVASPDFRSSYFSTHRKYYDLYIDLLMQLEQDQPGRGFAVSALLVSENARARSLCEMLAEGGTDIRQGVKPEVLKRQRELESLLRAAAEYRAEEGQDAAEMASKVDLLRAEYAEVQAQLRQHNPRFDALAHTKALSIADIQTELRDDNTLLLEYALGDERSYVWSVTAHSVNGYILPGRAALERAAGEVYEAITARQVIDPSSVNDYPARIEAGDRQYAEKSLLLSRMLLQPVAHELGNKRLIIVSEGALQSIPFDALPSPDKEVREPLIARHEVVNLPSVSALAAIRTSSPQPMPASRIAVFADPVFSSSDERVMHGDNQASPNVSASGLIRLTHTADEAAAIAGTAPYSTRVVRGFAANRDKVLSPELAHFKIVHFATHGVIDSKHPELSGLILSMTKPDGTRENGYLQLHDIYNLRMSADLTVLSACNTALGKDIKGEGLVGLTRGFIYAGSRSVVASLWKVDDRATAVLMKHFYRRMLHDGLPPAAALRSAKEIVRSEPGWSAPYFWAGFVIQGEYLEPIKLEPQPSVQSMAVVLLMLLPSVITASRLIKVHRRTEQINREHA